MPYVRCITVCTVLTKWDIHGYLGLNSQSKTIMHQWNHFCHIETHVCAVQCLKGLSCLRGRKNPSIKGSHELVQILADIYSRPLKAGVLLQRRSRPSASHWSDILKCFSLRLGPLTRSSAGPTHTLSPLDWSSAKRKKGRCCYEDGLSSWWHWFPLLLPRLQQSANAIKAINLQQKGFAAPCGDLTPLRTGAELIRPAQTCERTQTARVCKTQSFYLRWTQNQIITIIIEQAKRHILSHSACVIIILNRLFAVLMKWYMNTWTSSH